MLKNRLEELKSDIFNPKKKTDIIVLDEEELLKAYVRSSLKKIIASRSGEIEIVEK